MRIVPVCLLWAILGMLAVPSASAGMLDNSNNEWAFDLNYTNQSSNASSTNVNFSWGHLIGQGYTEAGLSGTYQRLDDKTSGGNTVDATIAGPFFAWNWTPHSGTATGFLQAGVGGIGGDLDKSFDFALDAALGVKCFVGNSAAVTAQFFFQRLGSRKNTTGQNENFDGIAIGIALYTGRK
ncbi:MAG TPA: hypothetical protein VFB49_05535 [Patescibacteria group bacterium]|nr:hypothetical protein [Patescibacteria group bacterium]